MKIEIENYYGDTQVILEFVGTKNVTSAMITGIELIARAYGYELADFEEEDHMRLQRTDEESGDGTGERAMLRELINEINKTLI